MSGDPKDLAPPPNWDGYEDDDYPGQNAMAAVYFDFPVEKLVAATSRARLPLVLGIRRYYAQYGKLSDKQRWCLAFWLADHDQS